MDHFPCEKKSFCAELKCQRIIKTSWQSSTKKILIPIFVPEHVVFQFDANATTESIASFAFIDPVVLDCDTSDPEGMKLLKVFSETRDSQISK